MAFGANCGLGDMEAFAGAIYLEQLGMDTITAARMISCAMSSLRRHLPKETSVTPGVRQYEHVHLLRQIATGKASAISCEGGIVLRRNMGIPSYLWA